MGQTQSQGKQQDLSQIYSAYIQQQQNLISQQQSQINSLYQHNLQSQQQIPPNMFFQHDLQQQQQQQHQQQQQQLPPAPTNRSRVDPYQVLELPKNFTEYQLKKAYLKQAMKTHPDRGGTPQAFQKVSIAYTVLTQALQDRDNSHSHHDLRQGSKEYIETQGSQPKRNINMKENFDNDVFNKIYEENKIQDVYDEGYGNWMESNPALESGQTKMFQNGFNKDMFNSTFDSYKQDQAKQYSQQLVVRDNPEERMSMKNQDSLVTLGQKNISDFSGSSDNLQYTDYKKAYTYGSTLIDVQSVGISDRAHSIDGVKAQRSNLSYQLSPQDQQRVAIQQMETQREEEQRRKRLQVYDQKHGQAYEKIHSMLLR
jgi:curved DNA-binding protein CbpA